MPHAPKDLFAGLVFIAIGFGFAVIAFTYDVGAPNQMGPGSFPLVLGVILVVLGGFIAARGLTDGEEGPIGAVSWRAVGLIVGAVIVFGLTVRTLGLVPSTFLATLMASRAGATVLARCRAWPDLCPCSCSFALSLPPPFAS
jgi:hypothetical protein